MADFPKSSGTLNIKTTQFADDTLISVHSVLTERVQEEINDYLSVILNYLNKWKIKVNIDKCEEISILGNIFQTKRNIRRDAKQIEIKLNNEVIPKQKQLKYLGIYFSVNFKFNFHLEKIRNKY